MTPKQRQFAAEAVLILVTFFWGVTFVVVQESIRTLPVHWFHTLRFGLGAVLMWGLVGASEVRRGRSLRGPAMGPLFLAGCMLGFFLFWSYAFQTLGLLTTTPSKSAFITGTAVLWVPFLLFLTPGRRVEPKAFITAAFGAAGLLFLCADYGWATFSEGGFVVGDGLTVLCAASVAVHLLLTNSYAHQFPTLPLTAIQLTIVAVLSLAASFAFNEDKWFDFSPSLYGAIIFLAVFPTAFNFWALTQMQRYTTEQRTAVIYLFEPLFAALTSYIVIGEILAWWQWLGGAIILGAVLMLETILYRRRRPTVEPVSLP